MSILKITVSSYVLIANEVLSINEFGGVEGGNKSIEKCGKFSKTRKLSKSRKLAKSGKKFSKIGNLPNFDTKKNESSFLTPNTRTAFNRLWLAFTKADFLII